MFAAALIYILAVMSPGPNFLLVSRFAASNSILAGVGASLGIVMVGLMFSISSVTGLAVLIDRYPAFNQVATIAGAIYLAYIAFLLFRSALRPATSNAATLAPVLRTGFWEAWRIGVLTNVTNMKTIAFMVSIFAGFLAVARSGLEKATVIAVCSSFEIFWYCGVALIFGQGSVQRLYARYSRQFDGVMAAFLLLFAGQTVWAL
jgi:threonine efflux protein